MNVSRAQCRGSKLFIVTMIFLFSSAIISVWIFATKLPSTKSIRAEKEVKIIDDNIVRTTNIKNISKFSSRHLSMISHLDNLPQQNHSSNIIYKNATRSHQIEHTRASVSSQHRSTLSSKFNHSKAHVETISFWTNFSRLKRTSTSISNKNSVAYDCKLPPGGFKGWKSGVVTKLTPDIHTNCTLLFRRDELEVERVQNASRVWPVKEHARNFTLWVKERNCTHYKDVLFDNLYTTKDEVAFPLAFALIVHDNPFQVFRLMKVIYRPHNIYCIHYDRRSSQDMKLLFNNLAMCLNNIIIASNITEVHWGHHSLMDAQMHCFRDLLRHHHEYPWRYVITLCGKELPLRTNREIVQLLKPLKGTSAIRTLPAPLSEYKRFNMTWNKTERYYVPTQMRAEPIPYNLTIYKSMIYFALTPEFVNYVLNDEVAIALSKFLKDAYIPEEHFYSTLFMIQGKYATHSS